MEDREKVVKNLIKEMRPRVTNIALKHLLNSIIFCLVRMLLLMHKTPNQVEVIINDFVKSIGLEGEYLELWGHLTNLDKEKFNLEEPLSEENYDELLFSLASEIVNNSLGSEDKNGK